MKYWECRRKLFGDDKYMHRMTISEALRDDLDAVQDGVFCLLPIKDSSGRQLLHLEPGRKSDGYSSDSLVRFRMFAPRHFYCSKFSHPHVFAAACFLVHR